jgi:ubiquinone/menaquinone biosynthesis C-methylase UbiE
MSKLKTLIRTICPPILWDFVSRTIFSIAGITRRSRTGNLRSNKQDLQVYWDSDMADILETWGEGTVWNEIQLLMVHCNGKVLDIACGTGKTMDILSKFHNLKVYGFDISDFLVKKALERGISEDRLAVCDATRTNYHDNYFDYAYSIGSLEHFTEDGILKFLSECNRIVRKSSLHMIPVSRSGMDEGWLKTYQSFYNNSINWWLNKYSSVFKEVYVLDSSWNDKISIGKWFVCIK